MYTSYLHYLSYKQRYHMDYFEEMSTFSVNADGSSTYTRYPKEGKPIVTKFPGPTNLQKLTISKSLTPAGTRCLLGNFQELIIREWSPSGKYYSYLQDGKIRWTNVLQELLEILPKI